MLNHLRSVVLRGETGQTNMEFGLIVSLIAVAVIAVVSLVGVEVGSNFNDIKDRLLEAL